jgi:tetratricopeptide (TPR) repeat protein
MVFPRSISLHVGLLLPAAAALLLLGAACGREDATRRGDDARGRHMRIAAEAELRGDWDAAVDAYESALRRRPRMAAAHRRLAPILGERRHDMPAALYHYRRYLELAPDAPDADAVREAAENCEQYIAAGTGGDTSGLRWQLETQQERIHALELELAQTRQALEAARRAAPAASSAPALPLEGRLAPAAPSRTSSKPAPQPAAKPASPSPRPASGPVLYTVQSGDTLSKIAKRHGTTSDAIFQANRSSLSSPDAIRIGMTLSIPQGTIPR